MFYERNIRLILATGTCFFGAFLLLDIFQGLQPGHLIWYGYVFGLIGLILLALSRRRVTLAGRMMIGFVIIIVMDSSAFYWSPGTVLMSIVFTFVYMMVLRARWELRLAVAVNLAAYTYVVAATADLPSPLTRMDYFSYPPLALLTTYAAHLLVVVVAIFIRRDQAQRDRLHLLFEQYKVDLLRRFLSHASHDLRTPLSNIRLDLYLLNNLSANAGQRERLAKLEQHVDTLEHLLLSMVEMARVDQGDSFLLRRVDLYHCVDHVVNNLMPRMHRKQQILHYLAETEQAFGYADPGQIELALHNILDNAIAYTPEGGTISVRVGSSAGNCIVEIEDTGCGIPMEQLPYIFDRFFRIDAARTQPGGSNGLGLSISRKIIDLHNGSIEVESTVGTGSLFRVRLPLA